MDLKSFSWQFYIILEKCLQDIVKKKNISCFQFLKLSSNKPVHYRLWQLLSIAHEDNSLIETHFFHNANFYNRFKWLVSLISHISPIPLSDKHPHTFHIPITMLNCSLAILREPLIQRPSNAFVFWIRSFQIKFGLFGKQDFSPFFNSPM